MALNLGLPRAHRNSGEQQQEIKEARKFLKENIRCDWEYPPLPKFQTPPVQSPQERGQDEETATDFAEKTIAGFKFSSLSAHDSSNKDPDGLLDFEPISWREREYSTSTSSSSEDENENESAATTSSNGSNNSKKSTYKFDGPDSVGAQISDRKLLRKRKRRKQQDEEVAWNDGLAHWLARRDLWCAAHSVAQVQIFESRRAEQETNSTEASVSSTPRTSTSTSDDEVAAGAGTAVGEDTTTTPATTPDLLPEEEEARTAISAHIKPSTSSSTQINPHAPPPPPSPSTSSDILLLLPVTPQILPNHPVRRRITPETYPEIYTKIILQSRNPSVPINLLTMVRALVQGWKEDGEWPPKDKAPEKGIARKKGKEGKEGGKGSGGKGSEGNGGGLGLRGSVKAVGRVLRITSSGGNNGGGEAGTKEKEKG